jgi:hypothetical protein
MWTERSGVHRSNKHKSGWIGEGCGSPGDGDFPVLSRVGALTARGQCTEYLGSLPADVLQTLPSLLQVGKLNFIVFGGYMLYRGTADISSVHFEREYDPEDW